MPELLPALCLGVILGSYQGSSVAGDRTQTFTCKACIQTSEHTESFVRLTCHTTDPLTCHWVVRLFQIFTLVNFVALDRGLHISFQINIFVFYLGERLVMSGIAGSCGNTMLNFWRSFHTAPRRTVSPTVRGGPFSLTARAVSQLFDVVDSYSCECCFPAQFLAVLRTPCVESRT